MSSKGFIPDNVKRKKIIFIKIFPFGFGQDTAQKNYWHACFFSFKMNFKFYSHLSVIPYLFADITIYTDMTVYILVYFYSRC